MCAFRQQGGAAKWGVARFDRQRPENLWVQSGYGQNVLVCSIGKMRVRWLFSSPFLVAGVTVPLPAQSEGPNNQPVMRESVFNRV
jgi:hypothetical protein